MCKIFSFALSALLTLCVSFNLAAQPGGGHGNNSCHLNLGDNLTVCPGKLVTLDAKGNFQTYQWSTGATTKKITVDSAGTYSVTVTGNHQCTVSDTIVVTVDNNALKVSLPAEVLLTCHDSCKTLRANVSNGTAPYTIVWNTGDSTAKITVCDTAAAVYTVVVTDTFGCTNTDTTNISFTGIIVSLGPDKYLTCGDTCTSVTANLFHSNDENSRNSHNSHPSHYSSNSHNDDDITFAWSNGDSLARLNVCTPANATYSVTVSDAAGCTGSDTVNIVVSDSICSAHGVLICHSTGSGTHHTLCVDSTDLQAYLDMGDSLGCCTGGGSHHSSHHSHHSAGNHSSHHRSFAESGKTVIEYTMQQSGTVTIDVFNMSGIKVSNLFSGQVDADQLNKIDFVYGSLPSGLYVCRISSESGEVYFEKILLQE